MPCSPAWAIPGSGSADVRWWLADPGKGRRDYAEAHLPGAMFVDLDSDLSAPVGPGRHPLPDPAGFTARMAALGIDDGSDVVAYDDAAARWPRACGGCSRTWDTRASACSTEASRPGWRSGAR